LNNNVSENNMTDILKVLKRFGRILTSKKIIKSIDPVIGRNDEIHSIIRILSRKTKNNPVLIGEPGVGKTAIVEGLAQRINDNNVPINLRNKIIYELDLGSLVAGSKFHGEFEGRLKQIINALNKAEKNIILFIDELHLIVGAGKTQGAMDASNLLKPILARGLIRCIGATTLNEYRQHIQKDGALERRFQKIFVEEPSIEETISILRGIKENYEIFHKIKITDKALVAAAELSARYINDRFLPDKAIDLIDEASATIKTEIGSVPRELDDLNNIIIKLNIELASLENENNKEAKQQVKNVKLKLVNLKKKQKALANKWEKEKKNIDLVNKTKAEINQLKEDFKNAQNQSNWNLASQIQYSLLPEAEKKLHLLEKSANYDLINKEVTKQDIALNIAKLTKISIDFITESQSQKLSNLSKALKKDIKGQDHAIKIITDALLRAKSSVHDPNRIIGSFLFLGPTGVGKTELARCLAKELFGNKNKIIQLDMSEYMEKHSISKIIGSPPGYIGYEQGGQLTEKVRHNPYCVILLDEIEKAHKDVVNILLQVFDKGKLTDSIGRNINFKNTIIIMTSNLIANYQQNDDLDTSKAEINKKLKKFFSIELMNRFDNIVVFKSLSKKIFYKIVEKELNILKLRIKKNLNREIIFSKNLINFITNRSFDKIYGARNIQRFIREYVETTIANIEHKKELVKNIPYLIDVKDNKVFLNKNNTLLD